MLGDLVVDRIDVKHPAEPAGTRVRRLLELAPWTWSPIPTLPTTYPLLANRTERVRECRGEIDRVMRSTGYMQDTDRRGAWRVRQWPLEPTGDAVTVADCLGRGPFSAEFSDEFDKVSLPDQIGAAAISFVEDRAALLNIVQMTNTDDQGPATSYTLTDDVSIARHGTVSNTYGMPWTELLYTTTAQVAPIAARILARFAELTTRVESFEFDSLIDGRLVVVAAGIDTGQRFRVIRSEIPGHPLELEAVAVGYVLRIDRNRVRGRINLNTISGGS
jgi:hypothetical protein